MNHLSNKLLLCGAVLAVTAGFALPVILSHAQDKQLENRVDQQEAESVQLRNAVQLEDRLKLLSGECSYLELGDGIHLNAEEAHQAALNMMQYLNKNDSLKDQDLEMQSYSHEENPCLVVSEDRSLSVVVWNCKIAFGDGRQFVFMVDDSSQKMLSMLFVFPYVKMKVDGALLENNWETGYQMAENWASMLADYYDFESVKLKEESNSASIYYRNEMAEFVNEMGEVLALPITISEQYIGFNMRME